MVIYMAKITLNLGLPTVPIGHVKIQNNLQRVTLQIIKGKNWAKVVQ
jgi:hypothetical protein